MVKRARPTDWRPGGDVSDLLPQQPVSGANALTTRLWEKDEDVWGAAAIGGAFMAAIGGAFTAAIGGAFIAACALLSGEASTGVSVCYLCSENRKRASQLRRQEVPDRRHS